VLIQSLELFYAILRQIIFSIIEKCLALSDKNKARAVGMLDGLSRYHH
jgi:hypothetical protein